MEHFTVNDTPAAFVRDEHQQQVSVALLLMSGRRIAPFLSRMGLDQEAFVTFTIATEQPSWLIRPLSTLRYRSTTNCEVLQAYPSARFFKENISRNI
jgi:hypothetical protein